MSSEAILVMIWGLGYLLPAAATALFVHCKRRQEFDVAQFVIIHTLLIFSEPVRNSVCEA